MTLNFQLTASILICLLSTSDICGSSASSGVLHVLWMAPLQPVYDGRRPIFSAPTSVGSLALAVERVIGERLLGEKQINVTWVDSACDPRLSVGRLVQYMEYRIPDVIVGPPCTVAMIPVADVASYFNIPVFGWVSDEPSLDQKGRASTLVRTLPPLSGLGDLLLAVCRELNWHLLAIVSTEGSLTQPVADFFAETLQNNPDFFLVRHFRDMNASLNTHEVRRMLSFLKSEARVIFLIIPDDSLRDYLLAAHDEGMTSGDFQFLFARQRLASQSYIDVLKSEAMWKRNDARDDDARQAYRNLLYFTFSFILEWDVDHLEARDAAWRVFGNTSLPKFTERDVYSRFLHDAFYLFCRAYNDTVTNNLTANGENIFEASTRVEFKGLTGHVNLSPDADRLPSFLLWDMRPDNTFRVVLNITYFKTDSGRVVLLVERTPPGIYWGNGKSEDEDNYVPPDRPPCGFSDELCPADNTLGFVLPILLTTIMLAGILVFFILFRWWRREQELYRRHWRVKWGQLSFEPPHSRASNIAVQSKSLGSHSTASGSAYHDHSASSLSANSSAPLSREGGSLQTLYCKTAQLNFNRVAVRMIRKKNIRDDRKLQDQMRLLTTLKHCNLTIFYGLCMEPPNLCVLWEYCEKGSIQDLFRTCKEKDYKLDSMFQFAIAMDICTGLNYLHNSEVKVHGNLTSSNCLIDSRWTCKLSGFGQGYLLKGETPDPSVDEQTRYSKMFWTAPESLRLLLKGDHYTPTQTADIFSTAIILKEILCKNEAFEEEIHVKNMTPKDIVHRVAATPGDTLFRPWIRELSDEPAGVMYGFVRLVHACWQEDPNLRPTARRLLRHMKKLNPFRTTNIMDNMVKMMERYSSRLEELVAERTSQLEEEKRKTDILLYRLLPQKVAEDLKRGMHVQAETFTAVTIYFSDIVGFTQIASCSTPMQIVDFLNSLYTVFDNIIQDYDVYKVETIGDAYMVVSGIPVPNGNRHVGIMADMSLALLQAVFDFVIPHMPHTQLRIRIGLNTGPVVAGVVGNIMPRYCLFGDAVNLASRMESHGLPLKIHISPYTYEAIKHRGGYIVLDRGEIDVKGKGRMHTYFLEGKSDTDTDTEASVDRNAEKCETGNPSTVDLHCFHQGTLLPEAGNKTSDA